MTGGRLLFSALLTIAASTLPCAAAADESDDALRAIDTSIGQTASSLATKSDADSLDTVETLSAARALISASIAYHDRHPDLAIDGETPASRDGFAADIERLLTIATPRAPDAASPTFRADVATRLEALEAADTIDMDADHHYYNEYRAEAFRFLIQAAKTYRRAITLSSP